MLTADLIKQWDLSGPACETMWRLRAENIIAQEDYEVLRAALYKLAELEEHIEKNGFQIEDTYLCPRNLTLETFDLDTGKEESYDFVIRPNEKWFSPQF